jgi:hypothetical protein
MGMFMKGKDAKARQGRALLTFLETGDVGVVGVESV